MSSAIVVKTPDYEDPYVVFAINDNEQVRTEVDDHGQLLVVVADSDRFNERALIRFASGRWDFVYTTEDIESDFLVGGPRNE